MKKILKLLLFVSIIGLSTILIPTSVKGFDEIDFEFQRDILLSSDDIEFDNDFNLRDSGSFGNTYNATYSFTDDPVGDNDPIGWITTESGSSDVRILADKLGHGKVVELEAGASGIARIDNLPSPKPDFGVLEYWITTDDRFKLSEMRVMNDGFTLILVKIDSGRHEYFDGDLGTINMGTTSNNLWSHIRIEFECTVGGFKGLDQYHFSIYLNGIIKGRNILMTSAQNEVDTVRMTSIIGIFNYRTVYDAIGFTWESYRIGDNFFPELELDGLKEIDKFEFALDDVNEKFDISEKNPSGFPAVEIDDGFIVLIDDPFDSNDMTISCTTVNANDWAGILRSDFSVSDISFLEVYFRWALLGETGSSGVLNMTVSSSTQLIVRLSVDLNLRTLSHGKILSTLLRDDVSTNIFYDYKLKINLTSDIVQLQYFEDDILIDYYIFSVETVGQDNLDQVTFLSVSDGGSANLFLDSIGIYTDGISQSSELGWSELDLDIASWNTQNNNLFKFTANNNVFFGATEGSYEIEEASFSTLIDFDDYNNTIIIKNLYDSGFSKNNPSLIVYYISSGFSLSKIDIEGAKLVQGVNEYFLEFESSGVDTAESFFFVDTNNKLQFLLNVDTNGVLEFIQAEFNINNRSSTETIISFTSIIDNNAFGFFRVNFNDTSQLIPIENLQKTKRVILINDLTIDSFIILVSDTNKDFVSGLTTGFVSNIKLLDVNEVIVSVSTLNLIEMIVPLILIMTPTFILSLISKKFIVPLFVLMSIILTISSIIPIWLFFIIGLSCSMFIFFESESSERDDF